MDMPAPSPAAAPPPQPPARGGAPSPGGLPPEIKAKAMALAQAIPMAEKPFPVAAVQSVVDAFNEAKSALIPHISGEMPMPAPDTGDKFSKLPPDVYVPIALMLEEMAQVAPDAAKYACDVATLKDLSGLRTLSGKLLSLAKDKKVIAAVKHAMEGAAGEAAEGEHEETGDEMTPTKAPIAMKYARV